MKRTHMGRCACAVALLASATVAAAAEPEFRALACSRFEWPNKDLDTCKAYIDGVMQRLHDNNFNAVIFQMRGQCDTLYPSPYEPWSYILSSDGNAPTGWGDFDPMAYAINKAHENGLEFHAYLNGNVCWNQAAAPTYAPNHIFWEHCNVNDAAHRDWLPCNSAGNPVGYVSGGEYVWIAPGIPDFQAYWRKQIMYVMEHYDGSDPVTRPRVDGVHFDRIRTNSTDWSHDPVSESRRLGDANPAGLSFADWTRDQLTRMLCDLYAQINEHHPYVKVSSAPLGMHSGSRYPGAGYPSSDCGYGGYGYSCKFQDAQAWLAAGAQDFICPQIYWADPPWRTAKPNFSVILPDWLYHNAGRHVYAYGNVSATGEGLLSENNVMRTMAATIGQGNAAGNVYWYHGGFFGLVPPTYTRDLGPLFSGPGGPYAEPTPVPPMPWKDTPTQGTIVGNVTAADGVTPIVDAQITRTPDAETPYVALSSGDGLYSFLKVDPGTYTLKFSKAGLADCEITDVEVTAGGVVRVDISLGAAPAITEQPAAASVCPGEKAEFKVAVGRTCGLSYQWQKDGADLSDGGEISGAATSALQIAAVKAEDAGAYHCVVTNTYGSTTSDDAALTVKAPTLITQDPQAALDVCPGSQVQFTVAASGEGVLQYEWQKDGATCAGAQYAGVDTATLTISGATAAEAGQYACLITAGCGTMTSATAALTLSPDSDSDGNVDCVDACPNSDTGATIVIGYCDSGVGNQMLADGCTMADEIAKAAANPKSYGQWVSAVAHLTNEWKKDGLINGKEKGKIQSCAAKAPAMMPDCGAGAGQAALLSLGGLLLLGSRRRYH